MVPDLFFYQLVLIAVVWLYFMLHGSIPTLMTPAANSPYGAVTGISAK